MLTEEDAKTKWCPFARVGFDSDIGRPSLSPTLNRLQKSDPIQLVPIGPCIGSLCMAWRWRGWVNRNEDGSYEESERGHGLNYMPRGPTQCAHGCDRLGFCGLAGTPQ